MSLERIMQICVASLAVLGTLLFGVGQQSYTLPVLSTVAAVTSVYVTDARGWIRLNRSIANLAAVLAVSFAVVDFFNFAQTTQLLALANLLVYLQVILLFQRKDERIYWQLLMLSLLQVMVATALNFGILFGILLVAYLLVALVTLSLFVLLREAARVNGGAVLPPDASAEIYAGASRPRRDNDPFQTEQRIQLLPPAKMLPGIGTNAICQAMLTLGLTALLFFMFPRTGQKQLMSVTSAGQRMVGFSDSVELGELGHAFQSDEDVMRVHFHNSQGQLLTVQGTPIFRGTVLNNYRSTPGKNGGPRRSRWEFHDHGMRRDPTMTTDRLESRDRVYQETELEPMKRERTVFQIYPAIVAKDDSDIQFDTKRLHLKRRSSPNRKISFNLETTGFEYFGDKIKQHEINPAIGAMTRAAEAALTKLPSPEKDRFPQLRAEAARVLEEAEQMATEQMATAQRATAQRAESQSPGPLGRLERAKALENYFLSDPRFGYTLEGQRRDPTLDPIEDFIAHRPLGHCEYYASALALMLRSQNIPARIVIGFKGGRWNSYGKFFQVEQLNAHSWVEVYLRQEQVPAKYLRPSMRVHGAWLRLDPTPGLGGTSGEATELTILDRARELGDYSQYLWGHYVVGLNSRRQNELIYEPLASLTDKVSYFFSKQMWLETVPAFLASLTKASTWASFLDHLLTLRGLLLTLLTLLLAYLVRRGLRRWSPGWVRGLRLRRRRGATEADTGRSYPTVEFYQRFEKLLARHGLARSENQTQHEFAVTVGGEFRSRTALHPVASVPKHLSDLFYEVRFGGHTLDKQQTDAVEQSLGQLATALASDDADRNRRPDRTRDQTSSAS